SPTASVVEPSVAARLAVSVPSVVSGRRAVRSAEIVGLVPVREVVRAERGPSARRGLPPAKARAARHAAVRHARKAREPAREPAAS
ncbi:MAG TPA: hypothetical protein VF794_34070, partial [Archangium sp.]|uniref:hypothetical protein n=1 Tax=Archangium sp. TaxID=1872627 RepID=UPI002ED9FC5F